MSFNNAGTLNPLPVMRVYGVYSIPPYRNLEWRRRLMSKACKALLVRKSNKTGSIVPLQSNSSVLRDSRPRSNANEGGKPSEAAY